MSLHALRSSISIIPQAPVVFTGTIRRNLDPLKNYTEKEIWAALSKVGLKEKVKELKGSLDTDMTQSSNVFSVGQKQLICLARTLLLKNNILVLDEATSNIDNDTDALIQKTIMEEFKQSTVITIAHRLITIANYDKIAVIDKGRVVEYDHPFLLLAKNTTDEQITNINGKFAQMVLKTGSEISE